MGLILLALPVGMILAAKGHPHPAAGIMTGFGYFVATGIVFLIIIFANFFESILDLLGKMETYALRSIGVLNLCIGGLFIYLGLAVFG